MGSGLSRHEIQVLGRIESDLRSDRALDRALRTMRAPRRHLLPVSRVVRLGRQIPAASVALMVGFAILLTVMVVQIGAVSGLAFLGVVWVATLLAPGAKVTAQLSRGGSPGRDRSPRPNSWPRR